MATEKNDITGAVVDGLLNGKTTKLNGFTNGINGSDAHTSSDNTNVNAVPFKMPRAPPHVYSCFVVNNTSEPVNCTVHYDGRPGESTFNEDVSVVIPANGEKYFPRKFFQPDLPESYCRWVKIVTHIQVKKQDGKVLEVAYPFDNVHAPIRNWEFHVGDGGNILSKPPTRQANILKYENLNEYEQ